MGQRELVADLTRGEGLAGEDEKAPHAAVDAFEAEGLEELLECGQLGGEGLVETGELGVPGG